MSEILMNPHHAEFILKNSFFLGGGLLERYLELLDAIDPLERHKMFAWWVYGALGLRHEEPSEHEDEERYVARIYEGYKERCRAIAAESMTDYLLVHALVTFTLLTLREAGSDERREIDRRSDESLLIMGRTSLESGKAVFTEDQVRDIEERLVNGDANRELAKERYEHFCDAVVKELLAGPPDIRKLFEGQDD